MNETPEKTLIPARLPGGKMNPEYYRAYRKTSMGAAIVRRWNESEEGIASRKKYRATKKAKKKPKETGEEYAARIIRELEEISKREDNF